ncbi:substrate-binding periplasmic protein [Pseudoalteromonas ardens]|uniref:Amino acid ABC transporter substrate-binding protein n=1 Tax=Pseudoalteromonas rubra TaxID=43658 RepID=A0A0L0EWL8_9GAMM|nr:transporter substrate-binding domain-containing protein [Pseudoalteromonas sp. R96]KNC68841.1 amino acid ABC transporter substrate-binding protein [Pseudoalteromonas rubra]MDK1311950.1 transporter substrate-binding domain-containing protein [Pseudoalteromonas sp. R96]
MSFTLISPFCILLLLTSWLLSGQGVLAAPVDQRTDTPATREAVTLKYSISGSGTFYPYFTNDSQHPGILPELVSRILTQSALEGENIVLPTKRTNRYLASGKIDFDLISPAWLKASQLTDPQFVFSDPMLTIREYVVTRVATTPINSLAGRMVGTVRGYYYHDDNEFVRVDFESERALIQALNKGRIDIAIIGDLPAQYWSAQDNVALHFNQLHSHGALHIRLRAEHAHLLPILNKAIQTLRDAGQITRIETDYLQRVATGQAPGNK